MAYDMQNLECDDLIASSCGGKKAPFLSKNCTGCMPRPYAHCLENLMIPKVCDMGCDSEQVTPSIDITIDFGSSPQGVGDNLFIEYTITNDGDVPLDNVVANLMGESFELGSFDVGAYFTGSNIYTLTTDDVLRGYVKVSASAQGEYESEIVSDSNISTYVLDCAYSMQVFLNPSDGVTYDYHVGDTLSFDITLDNNGTCDLGRVVVDIPINQTEWVLQSVTATEQVSYRNITHKIKDTDVVDGEVHVNVTATSNLGLTASCEMILNIIAT